MLFGVPQLLWRNFVWSNTKVFNFGLSLLDIRYFSAWFTFDDFVTYADDNSKYAAWNRRDDVIQLLQENSINLFKLFPCNQMKENSDKCHPIENKQSSMTFKIVNIDIERRLSKILPGIKVDTILYNSKNCIERWKKGSVKLAPYFEFSHSCTYC